MAYTYRCLKPHKCIKVPGHRHQIRPSQTLGRLDLAVLSAKALYSGCPQRLGCDIGLPDPWGGQIGPPWKG